MLKTLSLLLGLVLGCCQSYGAPVITVGSASTTPGTLLLVPITITGAADIFAYQFDVHFDPVLLSITAVSEGSFLPGFGSTFFIPGAIDNSTGSVTFTSGTLIGGGAGANGAGTLALLSVNPLRAGSATLQLQNVALLDSSLNDILSTNVTGVITIGGISSVPEPNSFGLLGAVTTLAVMLQLRTRQNRS